MEINQNFLLKLYLITSKEVQSQNILSNYFIKTYMIFSTSQPSQCFIYVRYFILGFMKTKIESNEYKILILLDFVLCIPKQNIKSKFFVLEKFNN